MKKAVKPAGRDLIRLIPCLTENQILDVKKMACVRGGTGDGDGGAPILIPPPPPL
jgi:hypothetical protein